MRELLEYLYSTVVDYVIKINLCQNEHLLQTVWQQYDTVASSGGSRSAIPVDNVVDGLTDEQTQMSCSG